MTTPPSASSSSRPWPTSSAGSPGRAPLVLVLDDLHWAEPTALLLLRHVSRALADVPLLLAVSWRDTGEEPSGDLRQALADLDRTGAPAGSPRRLRRR